MYCPVPRGRVQAGGLTDDRLRAAIESSGACITHEALPDVQGDPSQVASLFQILLGNAIQFRGRVVPAIHVSARMVAGFAEFSVTDNGIGIQPEQRERLFDPFRPADVNRKTQRSGLGLALCKRILERHGGRIRVESRPGMGSTFRFTLPVAKDG